MMTYRYEVIEEAAEDVVVFTAKTRSLAILQARELADAEAGSGATFRIDEISSWDDDEFPSRRTLEYWYAKGDGNNPVFAAMPRQYCPTTTLPSTGQRGFHRNVAGSKGVAS